MTFVGKIFTVMIFIFSLVFMAFAIATYATHQSWYEVVRLSPEDARQQGKPTGLKHQLDDLQAELRELNDEKRQLEDQLHAERVARRLALAQLETELQQRQQELAALQGNHASEVNALAEKSAALKVAETNLAALTNEVNELRQQTRDVQNDRDTLFTRIVNQVDENHQLALNLKRLEDRRVVLADELAQARRVLQAFGLSISTPVDGVAPRLQGEITAVRRNGDDTFATISLGSDDGLRVGHQLDVYRGGNFIGRIRVTRVEPNVAVGVSDARYLTRPIQQRDQAFTVRPLLPHDQLSSN